MGIANGEQRCVLCIILGVTSSMRTVASRTIGDTYELVICIIILEVLWIQPSTTLVPCM